MNWKCSDSVSLGFKNQGEMCLAKGLRGWAKSLKSDLRCCDEPKLPPVSAIFAGAEGLGEGASVRRKELLSLPGRRRAALKPWSSNAGLSLWAEFTIRPVYPSLHPLFHPSSHPSIHHSIHPFITASIHSPIILPNLLSTYPSNEHLLSTHCVHGSKKTEGNAPQSLTFQISVLWWEKPEDRQGLQESG